MLIVDRLEGDFAVCETDDGFINIPLCDISDKVKSGDILVKNGEKYAVDKAAAAARRKELFLKQNKLFK